MKTLLILRHAKSDWDEDGLDDHDRPLAKRGKKDAPLIGQLLRDQGLLPDLFLSSTAKRAHSTAKIVAEACAYGGEIQLYRELYATPPAAYLTILRQLPDHFQRVLVVGHNPGLEELIEVLTGETESLPTAALAYLALPIGRWQELSGDTRGELVHLWMPKNLK